MSNQNVRIEKDTFGPIEVPAERVPENEDERAALEKKLISTAEFWTRACVADRHAEISEL